MKTGLLKSAFVCCMLATGLAGITPAFAQDYYGAIAYSPERGAWGWAKDYQSQDDAEDRAMDECEQRSEGTECRVATWFRNGCGSLASGPNGWGADWGNSDWEAATKAMERCSEHSKDCKVKEKICVQQ